MKEQILDLTRPIRHRLSKMFSPKLCYHRHKERPFIDFLSTFSTKHLVGAEIGVSRGENAENIIQKLNIKKLFLVDPYIQETSIFNEDQKQNKETAIKRLAPYHNIVEFVYKDSVAATKKLPPLDFAYIDGDHSFEGCKRDIEAYYKLIKKGGYLGGHDFNGDYIGVVRSVLGFVEKNNVELFTKNFDWWFKK